MKELDGLVTVCRTSRLTGKQTWMEIGFIDERVIFTKYRGNGPLLRVEECEGKTAEEILRDKFSHNLDWFATFAYTYSFKMAHVTTMYWMCDKLTKL